MKVAVIGSRGLTVSNLGDYLPCDTTEIISGGAKGVDTCARDYALSHGIKITEYLPEYKKYGRAAPLKRNITIIQNADLVLAFWDGKSKGTKFVTRHRQPSRRPRARRAQHIYRPNISRTYDEPHPPALIKLCHHHGQSRHRTSSRHGFHHRRS